MIKPVIQWLEQVVRPLGFDPQQLTLETWQRLYQQSSKLTRVELSSQIRRELDRWR